MGIIILILTGALTGWLATIILREDRANGVIRLVLGGIVGALIAGVLLAPVLGEGRILHGQSSPTVLLIGVFGAVLSVAAASVYSRTFES